MFFRVPTRVRVAPGCVSQAGGVCRELGATRAFLVHDPGLADGPGLRALGASLRQAGLTFEAASGLQSNPRVATVDALAQNCRASGADVVVGLGGGSALDVRTTRHPGYAQSQACRPRVERPFGWMKTIGWLRKVKLRGLNKVDWLLVFASAAFNIRRFITLTTAPA